MDSKILRVKLGFEYLQNNGIKPTEKFDIRKFPISYDNPIFEQYGVRRTGELPRILGDGLRWLTIMKIIEGQNSRNPFCISLYTYVSAENIYGFVRPTFSVTNPNSYRDLHTAIPVRDTRGFIYDVDEVFKTFSQVFDLKNVTDEPEFHPILCLYQNTFIRN